MSHTSARLASVRGNLPSADCPLEAWAFVGDTSGKLLIAFANKIEAFLPRQRENFNGRQLSQ
jgi:hypothetical protein